MELYKFENNKLEKYFVGNVYQIFFPNNTVIKAYFPIYISEQITF